MRFKSRMFPLIDVMILLLGLFLVILAQAQLTVQPDDEPAPPRTEDEDQLNRVTRIIIWDNDEQVFYLLGGEGVRVIRTHGDLQATVPIQMGDDVEIDVETFVPPHARGLNEAEDRLRGRRVRINENVMVDPEDVRRLLTAARRTDEGD